MEKARNFFTSQDHFARHIGAELLDVEPGRARTRLHIEPHHLNGAKTVHGGAIFTLADFAFAVAANSHNKLAMGINTSTSFIRAISSGTLFAEATEIAINHKLASYQVRVTDQDENLVAQFQGTVYRKDTAIF